MVRKKGRPSPRAYREPTGDSVSLMFGFQTIDLEMKLYFDWPPRRQSSRIPNATRRWYPWLYLLDGIAIAIYSITVNTERLAYRRQLFPRQLRDAEDKLDGRQKGHRRASDDGFQSSPLNPKFPCKCFAWDLYSVMCHMRDSSPCNSTSLSSSV